MTASQRIGLGRIQQLTLTMSREALRDKRGMLSLLSTFGGMLIALTAIDIFIAQTTNVKAPGALLGSGLLATSLPLIALIGFASLAFVSTSVPLVTYRASGVLRELSTTPVRRAEFLLACLPIRLGLGLTQIVLLLLLVCLCGHPSPESLARIGALLVSGLFALLSLGCLAGARFRSPDRTLSFSFIAVLALIATSDVAFPFEALPQAVTSIFSLLPTTLFAQNLMAELTGSPATAHLWLVVLVLLGIAGAVFVLASRVFAWGSENE